MIRSNDQASILLGLDVGMLATLSDQQQDQLAEILEDYLQALEAGREFDREAIVQAHPQLAAVLSQYLDSVQTLYRAGVAVASNDSDAPTRSVGMVASIPGSALPNASQIGDYLIKHEIGRGGMGIVYAAQQISLGRQVALKTLPFAAVMDQKQVARFRNEAQAAAGLHHPNIVPVYGVGCERGVHYFSMQLIEGQSLEQAIGQLKSGGEPKRSASPHESTAIQFSTQKSIRNRQFAVSVAQLGQQAAFAIHYAHENGVLHRDIKPSNLLLDAAGKLWVTDFGLARIANTNNLTVSGDMLGTARYMSPEQAAGRMHQVDHRSDIYSLGITLYELLTLQPAFDADTRQQLLRAVELETPRPPRSLNPAIPLDLETIVLKAIEKDPDNRYASADELAEDLGHFLSGRPTLAKRPGLPEHAARWVTRHRTAFTVATAVLLLLLILASVSALLLRAEQNRTQIQAELAALLLRENQRVVDNFGALVDQRLEHLPGSSSLRVELLGELEKYYLAFLQQAGDDPALAVDLATAQFRLAAVHQRMGDAGRASAGYHNALAGFQKLHRQMPEDNDRLADVSLCHNNLGQVAAQQGEASTARRHYEQAIAGYQQLLVAEHIEGPRGLARAQMNLGLLLSKHQDPYATRVLQEAARMLRSVVDESPQDHAALAQLALCENNLASVLLTSDPPAAETLLVQAVSRYDRLIDAAPASPEYRGDHALALGNLAAVVAHGGDRARAAELAEQVIAARQSLVALEPEVWAHRNDLAIAHQQLGQFHVSARAFDKAASQFALACDPLRWLIEADPNDHRSLSHLGRVIGNQALAEARLGHVERATGLLEQAIGHQQRAIELAPAEAAQYRTLLEHHRRQLSQLSESAGNDTMNRMVAK
jgi:hypothetical protein